MEMKNLVSWLALAIGVGALAVSLWPRDSIIAREVILKNGQGVTRAIFSADHAGTIALFSDDGKEMFEIEIVNDGAQINLRGKDGRQRVRLSTWGSNYLSLMDESWNRRITIGDLWEQDSGGNWKTRMGGLVLEKDGRQEVIFQIPE